MALPPDINAAGQQDAGIDWFLEQIKKAARPDATRSGRKNQA